jgi:hypothetical protein
MSARFARNSGLESALGTIGPRFGAIAPIHPGFGVIFWPVVLTVWTG